MSVELLAFWSGCHQLLVNKILEPWQVRRTRNQFRSDNESGYTIYGFLAQARHFLSNGCRASESNVRRPCSTLTCPEVETLFE